MMFQKHEQAEQENRKKRLAWMVLLFVLWLLTSVSPVGQFGSKPAEAKGAGSHDQSSLGGQNCISTGRSCICSGMSVKLIDAVCNGRNVSGL